MYRLTAVLTALLLALAACGSSDSADHNDADETFASQMVPHHEQAVEMSDLVLDESRGASAEVVDLAERIRAAQGPEIETMRGWLADWGVGVDDGHGGHGSGHDEDHGAMDGMMSADQMAELESASGAELDRLWLTMMIEHHEGAVTMSETVLDEGRDPEVRRLAEAIIAAQEDEIREMQDLLDSDTP